MIIPIHIAEKLLKLLNGESIAASQLKHSIIEELIEENIIVRQGRIKKTITVANANALNNYLQNKFGISDLTKYIEVTTLETNTRSELTKISADSKLKKVRTFKGFMVNCYSPIEAELNGKTIILQPQEGIFQFIYDFENFVLPANITIVGIENPENFRFISKQQYLFEGIKPLFVSRYPQNQSKDLIKWLAKIPNSYLHFGDFDIAGIGIYLNEFKKHLNEKSAFYVPSNIDKLISEFGNRTRYNEQKINFNAKSITEKHLIELISIIHINRKGLDQELLIES